jgi:hypothetical protein
MKLMREILFFNENSIYNNISIITHHQNIILMAYGQFTPKFHFYEAEVGLTVK